MPSAALATVPDSGVVSQEFLDDQDNRTRPYGLDVCEMTRLDRLVETAVWNPEDSLADVLAEFADEARRAAAISHLRDPQRRRWPRRAR